MLFSRLAGLALVLSGFLGNRLLGEGAAKVRFDTTEAPDTAAWAASADSLAREWYPRLGNLLSSGNEVSLPEVVIRITPKYRGVAAASGNKIEMSAKRVTELPDDSRGVVIHELVHVVQGYPGRAEGWLTEGIADYIRCAIYESKPLAEFPRPDKPKGYRDSYKVAAGFLFWLESGPAPGIVRQVNAALRRGQYKEDVFHERTGRALDDLWLEYVAAFKESVPLPADPVRWSHTGGSFEKQADGTWGEFQAGKQIWSFREESRTTDHVELLDVGRNLRLRLTGREVLLQQGGGWGALYRGTWDAKKSS
jgi:hypothetical protein